MSIAYRDLLNSILRHIHQTFEAYFSLSMPRNICLEYTKEIFKYVNNPSKSKGIQMSNTSTKCIETLVMHTIRSQNNEGC